MASPLDNVELKFPLKWYGSLLMTSGVNPGVEQDVNQVYQALGLADGVIELGKVSSAGTYETWRLGCTVNDISTLHALFHALEGLHGVRMLI